MIDNSLYMCLQKSHVAANWFYIAIQSFQLKSCVKTFSLCREYSTINHRVGLKAVALPRKSKRDRNPFFLPKTSVFFYLSWNFSIKFIVKGKSCQRLWMCVFPQVENTM